MADATVVILDFDKTIIDVDSDYWVVDELGVTELFNQLLPTMSLNSVMTRIMEDLHSKGITVSQIVDVLKRIPIHPRILHVLKLAHALGCEMRIISDANSFFIDIILEHLDLRDCFSEINTNPGYVDEDGMLRIFPYHNDFDESPIGCCGHCPSNMCKGQIIERIKASLSENKKKIIYVGDGDGDYCPSLKLRKDDFVMPRKNFPVWDLICANPMLIMAEIHGWTDGDEFERVILQIIDGISMQRSNNETCDDCKLVTLLVGDSAPALLCI